MLMFRRFFLSLLLILCMVGALRAQSADRQWLNHVEAAVTAGTDGVGFDLSMSVNEHVRVRTGFSYMPRFHFKIDMGVSLEDGFEQGLNEEQKKEQKQKLKQLLGMLDDLTGIHADDVVAVQITPIFYNGKILVDWYPWHQKNWHLTAGLYVGPSHVGMARNYDDETAFLLALNGYNTIYQHIVNQEPIMDVGGMGFEFTPDMNEKFLQYGRATFYIGPKNDGSYYHAEPTPEGRITADCYANPVKPYLGFGYGKTIGSTGRCTLSLECGALMWGGRPEIITHEGVDLSHDMQHINRTYLRNMVNSVTFFRVYPVIEARLAWRIF